MKNWAGQRSHEKICQFVPGEVGIDTTQYCFGDQEILDKILTENVGERKGLQPDAYINISDNGSPEDKIISERHHEWFARVPDAFEYQNDPASLKFPSIVHGCPGHSRYHSLVVSGI